MSIKLTESAIKKINSLMSEEKDSNHLMFRVSISGGGCAGFQYSFSLDHVKNEDDCVFGEQGITVVIDEASLALAEGSEVDFVEELIGASFQIKNPNASSSCGCGSSFSI